MIYNNLNCLVHNSVMLLCVLDEDDELALLAILKSPWSLLRPDIVVSNPRLILSFHPDSIYSSELEDSEPI